MVKLALRFVLSATIAAAIWVVWDVIETHWVAENEPIWFAWYLIVYLALVSTSYGVSVLLNRLGMPRYVAYSLILLISHIGFYLFGFSHLHFYEYEGTVILENGHFTSAGWLVFGYFIIVTVLIALLSYLPIYFEGNRQE